ncbi:Glycosyltransferase involved in cell wall bisynthesis [Kaistella chaponensis]|uniref:Glycosyltransferase involved in cell wall bisynthesis n=1 Tax=Kaistella chaponensis TaxID=713588 RepID=A0A1N7J621_9FLAO|nr:glycosyltransferase family 4 protein [Kaistella chaponensis]SIS44754.1 Glycosyltransferase involved in cell wall bisynthesis [Kaistella chaponensis]
MKTEKKILFISHDASNTGAPKLLLALIKFIKLEHPEIQIHVLFLDGGVLLSEFGQYCECFLFNSLVKKDLVNRIKIKLGLLRFDIKESIVNTLIKNNYNVVYGNTILTSSFLLLFKKNNLKTVLHVHESKYLLTLRNSDETVKLDDIDHFIAVSDNVVDTLTMDHNVQEGKIEKIFPFVVDRVHPTIDKLMLKRSLGLENATIIGCVGYPSLIKGTDMLPQLCKNIVEKKPEFNFKILIIGGTRKNYFRIMAEMDSYKLGISDKLMFIENTKTPQDYYNIFDIFLSLSREESFSLATLNAAELEIPIVCFRDCGGPTEIVTEDAAFFADYLSIEDIVFNIDYILKNPEITKLKTSLAKIQVSNKFNALLSCQKLMEITLSDKI